MGAMRMRGRDRGTGSNSRRGVVVGGAGEGGRADGRVDPDAAVDLPHSHSTADDSPVANLGYSLADAESGSRRLGHGSLEIMPYL